MLYNFRCHFHIPLSSGSDGKESAPRAGDPGSLPGAGGKALVTHSSMVAWRIPWMEEPAGLQSGGIQSQDTIEQLTLSHFSLS